ncbi:MAG: alpha/beta hydrolase [Actinomycetia bacterium]|nr:alpha/beta hydrolase [Actinomycetes bacterium]
MTGTSDSSLPRWRTATVASGGEDIYYEVVETEAPQTTVLLTHGAGGSHAIWYQQVVALANMYRVITWDTRGFGNSTFRSGTHGAVASASDMSAVLDATGTERAHLVGQSMGGWWVTTFALAHPERVRSLVLTNTVAGLWTDALDAHFRQYVASAAADANAHPGAHPAIGEGHTAENLAHAFLYQQLNTFHSPPMADVFPALVKTRHAHNDVRALGIPMLVVTGTEDPIFPADLIAASAALLGARCVEIKGAGHSPYWEQPEAFNAALLAFLAGVEER